MVYLAKALKELGQEVIVLLSDKEYMDIWDERLRSEGIDVIRKRLLGLRDRPFRIFQSILDRKQIKVVRNVCEEVKPEIIHVNQQYDADGLDYLSGALSYARARVFGTIHMPMSLTEHPRSVLNPYTWLVKLLQLDNIKKAVLRKWYRKYHYGKIFVSQAMKKEFSCVYGEDSDMHVVYYGVPLQRFVYHPYGKAGIKTVAFCGRLVPQKDPLFIVESWLEALRMGNTSSKFLLIGDGFLRNKIESELRKRAPIGSWEITGWVENPQDYIAKSDVLIYASRFEGFPFAILEASCMGKVCISCDFPGFSEFSSKIPWIKAFNRRDPEIAGKMIIEALNSSSPEAESVEKVREYFSVSRMSANVLEIYSKQENGE